METRQNCFPGRRSTFLVFCALIILVGASGASSGLNAPQNLLPVVSIVSGPLETGVVYPYRLTIGWEGSDSDGFVSHFQYAIDPPDVFSEQEVADPENSPGITIEILPGPGPGQDTVRVSKVVDGTAYRFDWIQTLLSEQLFSFFTPDPDSVVINGILLPGNTFRGDHAFYLRGVDNEGGISDTNAVIFTVFNIVPESEITLPLITSDILVMGAAVSIVWTGTDPDGPEGAVTQPVGYLYKLIRLDTLGPPIPIVFFHPLDLFIYGGDWIPLGTDSSSITFDLETPGQYVFGIRAVDEGGAEEPFLDFGRNAFKFQAFTNGGKPHLDLSDPALGSFSFTGTQSVDGGEFPTADLHLLTSCDATLYGGVCADMRWGADLVEPDSLEGWSEWGPIGPLPAIKFEPGPHSITVQIKDTQGETTTATLQLSIIQLAFDREVLYVDDSFDQTYPTDDEHDQFWRDRIQSYGFSPEQVFEFHAHGVMDREYLEPLIPSLAEMGQHKLLIWVNLGSGYNGQTALLQVAGIKKTLGAYLRAGGRLWLSGRMTVAGTTPTANALSVDPVYPKEDLAPGDFAYDFLKLHTTKLNNDKGAEPKNTLREVQPFPGPAPVYDAMYVDSSKLNLVQAERSGVSHVDAIFDPIFAESEANFLGTLDSLYVYGATGNVFLDPIKASAYHNRLCALRWHDPSPDPHHGRLIWFGFPMYYFVNAQAQDTFNKALDWLRDGLTPVRLLFLSVERTGTSASLRWEIADPTNHAGFHVYRQQPGTERERLTEQLLTGQTEYEFTDPTPPREGAEYWLAEISRTGETTWHGPAVLPPGSLPTRLTLGSGVPNPFRSQTQITYSIPGSKHVELVIYDLQGRRVATLVNEDQGPGVYTASWDGRTDTGLAASGLYFLRLRAGKATKTQKLMFVR